MAHLEALLAQHPHLANFKPDSKLAEAIFAALPHLGHDAAGELLNRLASAVHIETALHAKVVRADGSEEDLGCLGRRVITATGVKWLTDNMAGAVATISAAKYHRLGSGTTNAAATDSNLQTEFLASVFTTYPVAGTQASATSGNNATYTSVATTTVAAGQSAAVGEFGLCWASTGAACFDHFAGNTFPIVNLAAGDSIQTTFTLTVNSGG